MNSSSIWGFGGAAEDVDGAAEQAMELVLNVAGHLFCTRLDEERRRDEGFGGRGREMKQTAAAIFVGLLGSPSRLFVDSAPG